MSLLTDLEGFQMCELMAVSSDEKINVNAWLKKFFARGAEMPNGWGLARICGNSVSLEKEPRRADRSTYLHERMTSDIVESRVIAHIRLATKGNDTYDNSHPFVLQDLTGRQWTFAHNGTIFHGDFDRRFCSIQKGQTDSERIFLYILSRINEETETRGRELNQEERFSLLDDITHFITPGNKMNFLLCDGELMYVHRNSEEGLFRCRKNGAQVFSTVPLDGDNWKLVPQNTLLAYEGSCKVFTGTPHENTYIQTEEDLKSLFLDYSAL